MKKLLLISLLLIACTKVEVEEPFVVYDSGVVKYVSNLTILSNRVLLTSDTELYKLTASYDFIYDDEYNIVGVTYNNLFESSSLKDITRSHKFTYIYEDDIIYCYCDDVIFHIYYLDSGYLIKLEWYRDGKLYLTSTYTYDTDGYAETEKRVFHFDDHEETYSTTYTWKNGNVMSCYNNKFSSYLKYKDNLNILVFPYYHYLSVPDSYSDYGLKFPGLHSTTFPESKSGVFGYQYNYSFDKDYYPTRYYYTVEDSSGKNSTVYRFEYLEVE